MVISRLLRGPATVALCCAVLVACGFLDQHDDRSRHRYTDVYRFGNVVANAFRATHPESRVTGGEGEEGGPPDEMAIQLKIEPNINSDIITSLTLAVRQDRNSGRIYYTNPYGAPIYWDYHITEFCPHCGGEGDRMTDDFRFWVNALEPADEAALNEFGLSLARLREAARTATAHGYIEHDANPVLLRKLLKQDYVRTIYLVRTQKHCADTDPDSCIPAPWPRDDESAPLVHALVEEEG